MDIEQSLKDFEARLKNASKEFTELKEELIAIKTYLKNEAEKNKNKWDINKGIAEALTRGLIDAGKK